MSRAKPADALHNLSDTTRQAAVAVGESVGDAVSSVLQSSQTAVRSAGASVASSAGAAGATAKHGSAAALGSLSSAASSALDRAKTAAGDTLETVIDKAHDLSAVGRTQPDGATGRVPGRGWRARPDSSSVAPKSRAATLSAVLGVRAAAQDARATGRLLARRSGAREQVQLDDVQPGDRAPAAIQLENNAQDDDATVDDFESESPEHDDGQDDAVQTERGEHDEPAQQDDAVSTDVDLVTTDAGDGAKSKKTSRADKKSKARKKSKSNADKTSRRAQLKAVSGFVGELTDSSAENDSSDAPQPKKRHRIARAFRLAVLLALAGALAAAVRSLRPSSSGTGASIPPKMRPVPDSKPASPPAAVAPTDPAVAPSTTADVVIDEADAGNATVDASDAAAATSTDASAASASPADPPQIPIATATDGDIVTSTIDGPGPVGEPASAAGDKTASHDAPSAVAPKPAVPKPAVPKPGVPGPAGSAAHHVTIEGDELVFTSETPVKPVDDGN